MKYAITINTHDIMDYVPEGGITVKKVDRVAKSITCMNGDLYKRTTTKRTITINLHSALFDSAYKTVLGFMTPNPAAVSLTDLETGTTVNGTFYITDNGFTARKAFGTTTLIDGASFSLEER